MTPDQRSRLTLLKTFHHLRLMGYSGSRDEWLGLSWGEQMQTAIVFGFDRGNPDHAAMFNWGNRFHDLLFPAVRYPGRRIDAP